MSGWIQELLGADADKLLGYRCKGVTKDELHLPGPDYVDRIFGPSDPMERETKLPEGFRGGRLISSPAGTPTRWR